MLAKGHRQVTVSGSRTGVDSPVVVSNSDMIEFGKGKFMKSSDYIEAKRYFALFQSALKEKHCDLVYNENTGKCSALGCDRNIFKFDFDVAIIKNHYCTFRMVKDDFNVYLAIAQSQHGIQDWFGKGLKTPPAFGNYDISELTFYKK